MCGFHQQRRSDDEDRRETRVGDVMTRPVPTSGGDYRVSAAERDAVIEQLRQHTGEGRLTLEEFGERTEESLAARTRSQLGLVLRELPRLRGASRGGATSTARHRLATLRRLPLPVLLFAVLAVAAVAGGHWWIIFPVLWFGGGLSRPWHHRPDRAGARV